MSDITCVTFCNGYHDVSESSCNKYRHLPPNMPWTYTPIEDGWLCVTNVNFRFFPWGDTVWLCPACKEVYQSEMGDIDRLKAVKTTWLRMREYLAGVIVVDKEYKELVEEMSALLDGPCSFSEVMVLGGDECSIGFSE